MTFKTLSKLRNMVEDTLLEIDTLIEEADENYKEFSAMSDKDEEADYWSRQLAKLHGKKKEFEFFLSDIDKAELK